MFKPEFGKDIFKITITIHENCQTFNVESFDGHVVSYQEIIGALDTVKMSYFFEQSGINIDEYRKWEKLKNRKKITKSR